MPGTAQYVAAIAHHTYDFPNDALRAGCCPDRGKRFDKPTWMTEICCYKGSGGVASSIGANYDPTMTQGFWLADQIDEATSPSPATARGTGGRRCRRCSAVIRRPIPTCPTRVNTKGFNDGLLYYDQHGVRTA